MSHPNEPRPRETAELAPLSWPPPGPGVGLVPIGMYPGPGAMSAEPEPPPPWYLDFGGVWRRHRGSLFLAALFCGLVAFLVGALFSTKLWAIEGKLRFVKQPALDATKGGAESMSLQTYANLVKGESILQQLVSEFGDKLPRSMPVKYLQRELKVETPLNTELIEITFDAEDPIVGVDLVNRLMQLYVEYTSNLRRNDILRRSVGILRNTIADNDAQISKWRRTIAEYQARANGVESPTDSIDVVGIGDSYKTLRQQILETIRSQEAEVRKMQARLNVQKSEAARLESDYRQNTIPLRELEKAQQEVRISEQTMEITEKFLRDKRDEYRQLPVKFVNVRIAELTAASREAENDLRLLVARLPDPNKSDPATDDAWTKLRLRLLGSDTPEFAILKPASSPPFPTSSNRKTLTLFTFVGPMLLFALMLAYSDEKLGRRDPAGREQRIRVVPPAPRGWSAHSPESPLLSVRIKQWIVDGAESANGHAAESPKKSPHDS